MSTKRRTEEEALAANKELEKKAAESAERIREDGGVWKVTLEDQAKYEAEHRKKKTAKASGAVSSKAGAAGGGYTPGAYYGGTDASAVKGKAGKTGAGSYGMSTGALKAALRRENDLQTAYRDYVQEAEAQAARQAKTPAMQRLKERRRAEIETAFNDYAENGLKDMYKAALEREVKQAREDEARNALFAEKALAEKNRENVRKANSSALEKARNSSVAKSGSAADFYKNRSETMGRGVIGDLENLEKIKNRDLGAELKLEGQKLKYQWEEAGRRYDALSEEEKRALYRRRNSSAIDRARMSREEEGLGGRTAQETRNRISNNIYERYKKLDEESRDPAKAEKYAFINRLRSAAGEGVENLGLWLYETFGYEPGKETYDRGEARAIGEVANEQVQRLVDAAPSQLGKDFVKVSDSVAQQLSYKILTAPISLFGGSIIADKVLSKTGSFAAAEKAARDFTGGTYTAGMASSSAADKYVQCRAEGQGKLEASVRAMGTGLISYFSESLGGIGGSKSPLSGLEEKYAESLIGSILYNAFEEGGEEFVEYLGDYLLDGAVDLAARGEWQQEWSWEEVIENAKIGAMSGGLFGGYNKLQNAVYSRIDEANAIRLEKAAREYSDYMKNAYRLMNDPNLREIAERRIGDTAIPSAMRTASRETGEMNFGNVLREKPGTVSAEQMYGVKLSQENKNEDFAEWAEKEDAEKVTNGQQIEENASYSRKIDNIESLSEGGYIPVGRVLKGSALNNIGLASTNIYFDKSKIVKSLDEHSDHITKEVLKQIPQILNEPMVITEANADNTVNVFGNVYIGSSPLMVGVMVTKSRDGKTEINKIRTVHARRDAGKKITDSSVLYLNPNIEKTQTWFQALGNDVPLGGTKFGFIRRITDKLKKVNSENQITKGTELEIKKEPDSRGIDPSNRRYDIDESNSETGDVPSPNANIPQNGNSVNTLDAENSAAKVQQNSENAAQTQQRKPGTVSAEQMYGVKFSQENKNEDFAEWAEKEDAKKRKAAEKEAILAEKQKNADSRSIRTDMTDDERYEALKNEKIKIEPYNSEKLKGENVEQLNATTSKEARKYIKTLAEKFEVFKKYISENARIEFRFSRNNLAESASKQGKIKAEYAEMLSATDAIVQNAVLVEAHKDKYAGTTREDKTLLQTDVLLSAFADENGIVPVRLTVKEYKDKDNSLYALITLEKIETEVSGRGESLATTPEPYPVSEMSIPDIVSKIKPTDGKILKYLPGKLLNAEQLEGKRAALAKDKEKIEGFSQKGDFAAKAQQNSENAAKAQQRKPGTVSAEQMYGVKLSQENKNEDFPEWNESNKKQAQIDGERVNALSLKERLTMIANKAFPKTLTHVKMGEMPTAVKATIGIESDAPLVMNQKKAYEVISSKKDAKASGENKNINWHGLGVDGLEKAVAALDNPLRAFKQENGKYGFVVQIDGESKPMYAVIEIDTKGNYRGTIEKANVLVTAFGTDLNYIENQAAKGTELKIKKEPDSRGIDPSNRRYDIDESNSETGDVPSPNANIPQNGNSVNTLDAENSAAKVQQNSENAAKVQQRKPGTVSAEQMYGVKLSQENKNEDFEQWAEKEDAKKKKAAEKEAILAEKQKNADNSNLTNREKYSLSEQEATEIKKGVSVITDADNNTIIDIKSNILENIPKEDWLARVKNVIRSAFSKGFSINGEHIDVSAKSRSEFTNSKDSAYLRDNESEIYADKMKTAPHLDIISQNANYENEAANHDRTDNIMSFDRGKVELRIGGKEYSAEVIIGVRKDGSKVFYDIVGMDANKKAAPIGSQSAQTANTEAQEPSDNISSNDSITDASENFKSKSENSAAKVQQAETEEEARLRTLYESEPENGQKEAGAGEGGTDKTDKFIEDTQKRIEDAKITDDKLKEMPEDKQKEVLKDRAERAGLDMDAEELVDFAQSLGRIKGFFGREFKDFARVFDDVSGESIGIRNDLHKFFEVPHRQAQAQYTEGYKNAIKSISEKFGELGIKAGSKESAAVQRIGEHAYQIDSKGNTAEYTEEMLKREFPKDWKKIKAAADYCEDVYYDYLKKLNAMYESIYPNTVEKAQGYKNKVLERAAASQQKADNMREVKNKYERDLAAKKELLKKKKEGTRVYAETQNQILNLESKIRNAEAAVGTYESRAFADKTKAELLQGQIDSGEILKNKQIKPRKDYFRHFQEMNNSFREIVDVFSNDQNISPGLIGKSAETKPRAMWLSEAQERSTVHAYTEDAVGGMLRYAKTAETALAYDPLISKFRDLSTVIRTAATLADQKTHGTGTSAAKLAEYIDLWTNNIAGKSYGLDRWTFDAMGNKGRAVMKAVDKINGNVKGSLVMLNFNTALKQISNVPNATAYIPNPADWARGASVTAEAVFGKTDAAKALRDARSQSSFMNERYIEDTISDLTKNIEKQNILSKPKKFEAWLIGAGDRAAAELIWYTAYTHYNNDIAKAMKYMGRNYDSAIDYADDVTRRSVAGRGRGETALAETSKLMGLVAPFQVETNNSYQLLKEQIGKKNAAGVIALQVNTFLLNAAYTAAIGSGVLGFDFIAATLDVIKNAMGADKDDDVLDKIEYAVGRYGGELLSGMPMGAQIAEIITAGDSDFADKLFGDNNPAKFGNGIALASTLVNTEKAVTKARKGQADLIDVFDAVSPLIGRRQLGRTVKGARSMIEGGVYGYDSEGKRYLKYAQGNGVSDWVKALMMGQYATNAGREYVEGGFKSLSAKDTALMNIAEGLGIPKNVFYDTVLGMKKKGTNKKKQEWLFANDKLTPEQKKIFDALYFGNGEEAVAAARKEADLAGAGTNKNDFYDILSGRISAKRDYGGEYEFENSGYTGKVQGQIRAAKGAEITREQLFSVLAGTKNKKLPDKMAEVYSTEGLTPEQQDKLGDIVLGDNGKGRRESYAAANVSISDRVLMEGILSDYSAQKKQTGDGEADELVKKTFIMDKLMAEGKSKYEAYRLYKIQDGKWANSIADLSDEEKKRAGAAKKQYGLSESDYVIIKNYSGLAEGEKDKYGNTVSGSNREDNIKNLAKLLHCSEEEAGRRLTIATGCAYSAEELSSSARDKLETGRKYGWTDEKWLKAANAIELSGVTKKEEKIKVLRDAGFSASEAVGYYNLNAGNDYYKSSGSGTPYGLNSAQYDKTKYWSEKSGKSEKEVAGYFKAIKGLTKKVDIIAALEAAGMSSSEANEFYALRRGRDSGYKAYKNGERF